MRSEQPTPRTEDQEGLAEAFWGVARALRHVSRAALQPWEVSPSHSRALRMLDHHGTMRLSELSEHLRIAPRSTTEVVDALEERGLVERRPDPTDRRATLVAVTDAGKATGEAIRAASMAESERLFADLTSEERTQLMAILRKLRAGIDW